MRMLYYLISKKKTFTYTKSGNRHILNGEDARYNMNIRLVKPSSEKLEGVFIFSPFNSDVKKFIKKGLVVDTPENTALYRTNPKVLIGINDRRKEPQVCMIDLNECFWKTAFNLGVISKKTYDTGRAFKQARNICIGKLRSSDEVKTYKKGKLVEHKTVLTSEDRNKVYWMIINEVARCMNEVMDIDGTFHWNVDCVMYDAYYSTNGVSVATEIKRVIDKFNYDYTEEPCFDHTHYPESNAFVYMDQYNKPKQNYV